MKTIILGTALVLLCGTAQASQWSLETRDEAYERQENDRYKQRQAHGGMEPLGGYSERLGETYERRSGLNSNNSNSL